MSDGKSSRVIHYLLEKWVSTDDEKCTGLTLRKAEDEPLERGKSGDDLYCFLLTRLRCRFCS